MIITYVDSGVLIAFARGDQSAARRYLAVLEDPTRSFVTGVFLRLEVVPKAA